MSLDEFVAEWMAGEPRSVGFYNKELDQVPRRSTPCRYPHEVSNAIQRGVPGVFLSVQPYTLDNKPAYLEKLFFDFDDKEKISRAWDITLKFAKSLVKFYDISPLITFSGAKGYHIYVWLQRPYHAESQEKLKAVYSELMRMLLTSSEGKPITFDPQVHGDIARLSRVPYSIHQKSGELCVPVNADLEPYKLETGFADILRAQGLNSKIVEQAIKNLARKPAAATPCKTTKGRMRPCMEAVLKAENVHDPKHLLKVGAVADLAAEGYAIDQIIQQFSGMEGFNLDKTRQQVDHALKTGYKPFKCATIQRLGGCLRGSCRIYQLRGRTAS